MLSIEIVPQIILLVCGNSRKLLHNECLGNLDNHAGAVFLVEMKRHVGDDQPDRHESKTHTPSNRRLDKELEQSVESFCEFQSALLIPFP